ncbi:MAG: restriction endonuclease subunit S [Haemophilus parainfluenzae]|nr:restriction endonuclease subunit S [Haemophilus parainfluenzae]
MRRYDSYKDSGVEWLGDVPSHWELKRLKQLFVEKKHKQNLSLNCGAISFGKVIEKDDDKVTEATKRSYQEVLKGEFLINPLNLNYDLISLRIALSEIDVVVSAGYIVLKAKQIINKKYFSYLLHRYDVEYMKLLGSGVRQTINYGHISDSILVAPPLSEQQKIAQFLDDKTAKIDQAMDLAEKQIALLKEHKQILIQNAVTRGLNPDVPLKDSGVEWIGQVPEHWEILSIKRLSQVKRGASPRPIDNPKYFDNDGEYAWVRISDVTASNMYLLETTQKLSNLGKSYSVPLMPGSLFLSIAGSVGKPIITKIKVCIHDGFVYFPEYKQNTKFLYYIFYSEQPYIGLGKMGTQLNLNTDTVGAIKIPIPPLCEQQKIADYLDTQTAKIDQTIALKTAHIEKLKEYKSVLINDVVTGKVRV